MDRDRPGSSASEKNKAAGRFGALRNGGGLSVGRDPAEKYNLPGKALSNLSGLHSPADLTALRFFFSLRTHLLFSGCGHSTMRLFQKTGNSGAGAGLPDCFFPYFSFRALAYRCAGRSGFRCDLRPVDPLLFQKIARKKALTVKGARKADKSSPGPSFDKQITPENRPPL